MKVLLTGAAGFIGSAVASELAAAGHEIVPVDVMLPQAHGASEPPPGVHRLDVRDADSWSDLLRGVDVVCHQAALVGAGVTVADLPRYAAHNDLGTAALLAAMATTGVARMVLASSMVVYGEGRYTCPTHGHQEPAGRRSVDLENGRFDHRCPHCGDPLGWALVEEDSQLQPRSAYAASKVAQEHYAAAWAGQVDGAVVALRYHNVYGPGMPRDTPYAGVAAMFRSSLERGERPRVFEDGQQMRDFVHVADVARANRLALGAVVADDAAGLAAYNVCSGSPVSIIEVARRVAEGAVGGSTIAPEVTGGFRPGDVRHVVASPRRADRDLGFRAEIAPETGLRDFATAPLRE